VKRVLLVGIICAGIAVAGCGGGAESGSGELASLVEFPSGPPPDEVVVTDIKKGQGALLKPGKWFVLDYIAYEYETKKKREENFGFNWKFGTGEVVKGWEVGLEGMRAGGRRQLVVPSDLAYKDGPLIYLIELHKVE
jgi:peptidylprolyl isomerase